MILYGITIMEGKGDKQYTIAKLVGLPPAKDFENDKIKISGTGFAPKTDQQGRPQLPSIDAGYAKDLIQTRAFVPNKDYEVVVDLNEDLEPIVTKIIPTDPQVKKHFDDCMKTVA